MVPAILTVFVTLMDKDFSVLTINVLTVKVMVKRSMMLVSAHVLRATLKTTPPVPAANLVPAQLHHLPS